MEIRLVACLNRAQKKTCKRAFNALYFHCMLFLGQSSDSVQHLPQSWETASHINFILDLILSPLWVLFPGLCCLQRLLKCPLWLWKSWAVRAEVLGWTSMSDRSDFFYTWWSHTDFAQQIFLRIVPKTGYLSYDHLHLLIGKREGKERNIQIKWENICR